MRVAIDAHNLWTGGGRSVGRNVVSTIPRIAPDHDFLVIVPGEAGYDVFEGYPNVQVVTARKGSSVRGRLMQAFWELPRTIRAFAPDVLWTLGNRPVAGIKAFQAVLVQDAHLFYPASSYGRVGLGYRLKLFAQRTHLRLALRSVDLAFCQTETAASRLKGTYGFTRVELMPNAVSERALVSGSDTATADAMSLHDSSFKLFSLTRYYPHKNLESIVDAFDAYPELLDNVVCFLTIDGGQHPGARRLLDRVKATQSGRVINLGPLRQERLRAYFEAADALIQPTLLESFSGTYLEAMEFGLPILTSDLDFAREICGDAAAYFDPTDPRAIAQCIAYFRDHPLERATLAAKGTQRHRSSCRDWGEVVAEAFRVIETLAR